jgi:hypothetical protein
MTVRSVVATAAIVATGAPLMAQAAEPVQLASDVFVERFANGPGGRISRILERADQLHPGDQVVFVVNWKASRVREFTVTNPMPRAISFQRSSNGSEEVSIDGGRNWGLLEDLRVREADGRVRHATPEDVTHLRWRVPTTMAAAGSGQLTYRGIVR